ncbi:MAG: polyprenyl synthetase family protein [Acidobacteriaceae bacterium]|nr:polyprenyl synthetase family protein [Acidobacteriaceae bacterium]
MTTADQASLQEYISDQAHLIDRVLDRWVPGEHVEPVSIHRAMRYSLFAGGKRIRPILAIAAARAVSDAPIGIENAAATLELVHTYSLIHDDLPAIDNDDLRRGRPTNHKVFGEAIAVLAGDALLTLAFEVLSRLDHIDAEPKIRLVEELSRAGGTLDGMIGGQVYDIEGERRPATPLLLEAIHRAKTGALLRASVRMGGIYAGASDDELAALSDYGDHVGLAFQIVDDVLDVEQPSETLGKTAGKDEAQHKITFPAVYGVARSRQMAENERLLSLAALRMFDDRADRLRQLADFVVFRNA